MQVYKLNPIDQYTGGCVLVAAKSDKEAISTFIEDEYNAYLYNYYTFTCNIIPDLDYNIDKPVIILNSLYIE